MHIIITKKIYRLNTSYKDTFCADGFCSYGCSISNRSNNCYNEICFEIYYFWKEYIL